MHTLPRVSLTLLIGFAILTAVLVCEGAPHTSVIGIDYGSEFIKVCAVKKDNTVDIVLNEQTRRKSNNFIGFRGEDRWLGEDARNLAARFPLNMLTMLNRIAGLGFDRPQDAAQLKFFQSTMQFPFHLSKNPKRGSIDVSIPSNPNVTHSVEELLSLMFGHLKDITEKDTEAPPRSAGDVVLSIPHYFNPRQRQSMVDAASLAGLKVLGTLHPTTATALYMGMMHQGFGNETKHVLIYDMGSTKTEVGVFTYSPPQPPPPGEKRVKLAHSLGVLTARAIVSDATLGGRVFDACIANELVRQFKAAHPNLPSPINGTTLAQYKSSFSLFRAANSLKEALSANLNVPIKVEGIAPEKDFQTKMTRDEFEALCAPLFQRSVGIAKQAIDQSGLQLSDLSRFELMGGGSRIPKLFTDLSALYGKSIDRTLNTDESAAFGVAYYAASKTGFRVRSFKVVDKHPYDYDLVLSERPRDQAAAPESSKPLPPAPRDLFVGALPGSERSITVKRADDFSIFIRHSNGTVQHAEVTVSGVRSALEALDAFDPPIPHENNTFAVRVELKLTKAGLISVEEASVKVTLANNITKRVKVAVNDTESNGTNTTEAESGSAEPADSGDDGAKGENATDTAEDGANSTEAEKKEVKRQWTTVSRVEMRRRSRQLTARIVYHEKPLPLDTEDIAVGKALLAGIEAADDRKRQLAQSKNDLEAYVLMARGDGLLENAELVTLNLINDTMRESITEALQKTRDWLEDGEGSYETTQKEQFDEQLRLLKEATAPVLGPYEAHKAQVAEALRNATLAKKKAAEEAAKAAKKAKAKSTKTSGKGDNDASGEGKEEAGGSGETEEDGASGSGGKPDAEPNEEL